MPRNRKRKRKTSAVVRAKNAVRGAEDPAATLAEVIRGVPPSSVLSFITWAERVAFGRRIAIPSAFPRQLSTLLARPAAEAGDFGNELLVLTSRLQLHRDAIQGFIAERLAVEAALHRSDYAGCEARLTAIEGALGVSIWLIEMRLAVTALHSGLEAQKALADELKRRSGRSPLSSVIHFTSQRNEPSSSAVRFVPRLRGAIDRATIRPSSKLHYKYHLVRDVPSDAEQLQLLLLHENTASLIDSYEAFISAVYANALTTHKQAGPELPAALDAIAVIRDPRLAKLRFLSGLGDDTELTTRSLDMDHALLGGFSSVPEPRATDTDDFRSVWLEALHRVAVDQTPQEKNTIRDDWVSQICIAHSDLDRALDAANDLAKWSLNLSASSASMSLANLLSDIVSSDPPFANDRNYRALLVSSFLDPWDLLSIPEGGREVYLSALKKRYGDVPVIRFVAWICGLAEESRLTEMCAQSRLLGRGLRSYLGGAYAQVMPIATRLETAPAYRTIAIRLQCNSLLALNLERETIRYAADQLARSRACYALLPIDRLLGGKKWESLHSFREEIGLAVLIDAYWRRTGRSEINSFRRYALEDFLSSRHVEKPSHLGVKVEGVESLTLVYFLSNVCVPEVMDLMSAFSTSRSVQDERRSIYALLVEIDRDNAETYRNEIAQITRTLVMDEGVRLLDQSRIFVDKEGVVRWAERELRESFDRYRSLHEAGVGFDQAEFEIAVRRFIEDQQPIPEQFLKLPKGEADILLLQIISSIRDDFLLSPTHGLDAYLSMRVRHGTLSGMLRGPLEQNHIINQKKSGSVKYQRNAYWAAVIQGLSQGDLTAIELAIMNFSEGYDTAIEDLRSRLQIHRRDRPDGIFRISLTSIQVYALKATISTDTKLDAFVKDCVEVFWFLLEMSLKDVRQFIAGNFRSTVATLFERLESALLEATQGVRNPQLTEAVRQARTQVQGVMDSIGSWFQRGAGSKSSYSLQQAVDVGVEVVKITYPSFNPNVTTKIDLDNVISINSFSLIGDVIFTALDNVYRHSGIDASPTVSIEVKAQDYNFIRLSVESELSADFDIAAAELKLAQISERIAQSEYKTSAVASEGGTGLMKLKSLADPAGERADALSFGFTPARMFYMQVIIKSMRA